MFLEGLEWVVGNGREINVWQDPWLFDGANLWVTSPRADNGEYMRVCDLFWDDKRAWDREKIKGIFSEVEAARIYNIPLCVLSRADRMPGGLQKMECIW